LFYLYIKDGKMGELIIIAVVIVTISILLLGVNIFIFGRKFPETEVGKNRNMIKLGLKCPHCEERNLFKKTKPYLPQPDKLRPDWNLIKVTGK